MENYITLSATPYTKVFTPLTTDLRTQESCQRSVSWQITGGKNAADFKIVTKEEAKEMLESGYLCNVAVMPWAWQEFVKALTLEA